MDCFNFNDRLNDEAQHLPPEFRDWFRREILSKRLPAKASVAEAVVMRCHLQDALEQYTARVLGRSAAPRTTLALPTARIAGQ